MPYTESLTDAELLAKADEYRNKVIDEYGWKDVPPEQQAYTGAIRESQSIQLWHESYNAYLAAENSLKLDPENSVKQQVFKLAHAASDADMKNSLAEYERLERVFDPERYAENQRTKKLAIENPEQWKIETNRKMQENIDNWVKEVKEKGGNFEYLPDPRLSEPSHPPEQLGIVGRLKQVAQRIRAAMMYQ